VSPVPAFSKIVDGYNMEVKEIASPQNTLFKKFLKLKKSRGIKKHKMALLSGPKQVREVLSEFPKKCSGIITSDRQQPYESFLINDIPFYRLSAKLFRLIDLFDTDHPILIVDVEQFPECSFGAGMEGCTLCVPFQDPANVGAVIRSAAAFGVSRVIVLEEAAHPFLPKSLKVAGSAIFRVPLFQGPALGDLNATDVPILTLSPEGKDIGGYTFPQNFCLVPGLEGPGLPVRFKESTALTVPMEPGVESINAAMATGIALYLWHNQSY
jgi:tRNA G18 (ribose-2'-O)-methylase SpoU